MGVAERALKLLSDVPAKAAASWAAVRSNTTHAWYGPRVWYVNGHAWDGTGGGLSAIVGGMSAAELWRTQPHLRTVVDFMSRNVAQLGLHTYVKEPDGGRVRANDSLTAQVLDDVDGEMTTYDLFYATTGDLLLYDVAYWWVHPSCETASGWAIHRVPPVWCAPDPERTTPVSVDGYEVVMGDTHYRIPALHKGDPDGGVFRVGGYSPDSYVYGSPKLKSLKATLTEQIEATTYRAQVWKRGGRVSSVIERPVDAEPWSDGAREAFREDWYAKFTGNGPRAGGTPILEDGMKLTRIDFNAREQQFVETAQLSIQTVAAAFHVHPTMLGYSSAPYASVQAYSRMLYTDTLGPILQQLASRVNKHLVPLLEGPQAARNTYVEFNIQAKLAGSFEEQASVLSSSVGAPWLTPNEARARQNLPALEGGDQLVVPLNVAMGAQASPLDSGTQNEVPGTPDRSVYNSGPRPALKSRRQRAAATDEVAQTLATFFERQGRVLRSKGAKSRKSLDWDTERWDEELADDLYDVSRREALKAATAALKGNDGAYNEARTLAYLRVSSARKAEAINQSTRDALEAAMEEAEEWDGDGGEPPDPYAKVYDEHAEGRANVWGASVAGFVVGFAVTEAARQNGGKRAMKTWVVTSGNPRASHASLDGETIPVDDTFSNGLEWPGSLGDPDEVAGCQCEVTVSW